MEGDHFFLIKLAKVIFPKREIQRTFDNSHGKFKRKADSRNALSDLSFGVLSHEVLLASYTSSGNSNVKNAPCSKSDNYIMLYS